MFINLTQGTEEWLEWRKHGIGASDAAAIMGISPWDTPLSLWERKTGRLPEKPQNRAMARGVVLEPEARAAWEAHTGELAAPMCVQHDTHDFIRASLDGLTMEGNLILEIKCPGAEDHATALKGQVPGKYWPQLQHQLACVPEAECLHYWSYRPGEASALVVVQRDTAYIQALIEREAAFWVCIQNDTPPVTDAWAAAAAQWLLANSELEAAKAAETAAREALIALLKESGLDRQEGNGVLVTKSTRKGALDYDKALKALGIEIAPEQLEAFRKDSTTTFSIKAKGDWQLPPPVSATDISSQAVKLAKQSWAF